MKHKISETELIEEYSSHLCSFNNLPPLTSKIYAFLLVTGSEEGITFDELVEKLNVSKSSVSTSLNLLINLKYIEHVSKLDCRKRYYKPKNENFVNRVSKIYDLLITENDLLNKLTQYLEESKKDLSEIDKERIEIYRDHLDRSLINISMTIEKLKKLKNN